MDKRTPLPPPPTQRASIPAPPQQRSASLGQTQMSPSGYGPPPSGGYAAAPGSGSGYAPPVSGYGPPPTAYQPPSPQSPLASSAFGSVPGASQAPYAQTGYGPPPTQAAPPIYGPAPAPMPANAYGAPPQGPSPTYGSLPPLGWQAGQTAYGSLPVPPSPAKSGPPVALVAGGIAGAFVALVAVIGIGYAVFHTNHKPLPVEAAKLPGDTDFFQQDRFPGADGPEAAREAFLASDLARHVCGAQSDFAARLMGLKVGKSALEAGMLFDPKTLDARRATLECGQTLAKSLESPSFTELLFHDGDDKDFHAVKLLRLKVDELPAKYGFAKQTFSGFPGYCLVSPKKTEPDFKWSGSSALGAEPKKDPHDGECVDSSLAAFRDGSNWYFGRKISVDAFARSYSKPKKELSTTVENLQLAFDSGEGLAMRRSDARAKAASQLLKLPCSMAAFDSGAGSKFADECLPKSVEKNASAIDGKVRAVTYEFDAPIHEGDGINFNLFFVGRDSDAAKEIEAELKDASRDWKSSIDNSESKLTKLVHDAPSQLGQKKWSVAIDPFLRAIKNGKVDRKGRVVSLRLSEKFSSGEMKEMNEVMAKSKEDAQAVATITEAMIKGAPVPEASLASLVGGDTAALVLAPRASDKDCASIREKLTRFELTKPQAIPASMRIALRLRCEGSPMPRATLKCLTDANDAATFGACPMPNDPSSPSAASAFKSTTSMDLEGLKGTKTILQ